MSDRTRTRDRLDHKGGDRGPPFRRHASPGSSRSPRNWLTIVPMTVSLGGERFELRERTAELSALAELLTAVARERSGRIALVYGEAGIGKTAIVRAFCESAASADVLWGRCDDLSTPRPLGPFVEIAEMAGPPLAQLLRSASTPYEVATALTRQLGRRITDRRRVGGRSPGRRGDSRCAQALR